LTLIPICERENRLKEDILSPHFSTRRPQRGEQVWLAAHGSLCYRVFSDIYCRRSAKEFTVKDGSGKKKERPPEGRPFLFSE